MKLLVREVAFSLRATEEPDGGGRTLRGVAVPLDVETEIVPGFREKIARGAIDLTARPALFYRHREPIGVITEMDETAEGLEIAARFSDTALGRDAATLAADGAIKNLSIGFFEREYTDETRADGSMTRTQTQIDLREVSLVPIPAYQAAEITAIREATNPQTEGTPMFVENGSKTEDADLAAIRETTDGLERRLALLETNANADAPQEETRSAGELLRAAVAGDQSAQDALASYVGRAANTTSAADARIDEPTFVADLTRLIDNANPLMNLFSRGSLPADGYTLEYARLKTNTLKVGKQENEGDSLPTGTIATEVATAKIGTYGGGTVLTRQAIERTRANVLDLSLRGMAIEAGKNLATEFAKFFEKTVKTRAADAITAAKPAAQLDWKTLLHLMLDAAEKFEDIAMSLDGLVVNRETFEAIAGMTDSDGRPILTVSGNSGSNTIGTVSASGRYVTLDSMKVVTNRYLTSDGMGEKVVGSFFNAQALRTYASGLVSLQDQSVLDLTNAFSVYQYAGFADEIPSALVPLKFA